MATLVPSFLIGYSSFLQVTGKEDNYKISDEFEFRQDPTTDCAELAVLEHLP